MARCLTSRLADAPGLAFVVDKSLGRVHAAQASAGGSLLSFETDRCARRCFCVRQTLGRAHCAKWCEGLRPNCKSWPALCSSAGVKFHLAMSDWEVEHGTIRFC